MLQRYYRRHLRANAIDFRTSEMSLPAHNPQQKHKLLVLTFQPSANKSEYELSLIEEIAVDVSPIVVEESFSELTRIVFEGGIENAIKKLIAGKWHVSHLHLLLRTLSFK